MAIYVVFDLHLRNDQFRFSCNVHSFALPSFCHGQSLPIYRENTRNRPTREHDFTGNTQIEEIFLLDNLLANSRESSRSFAESRLWKSFFSREIAFHCHQYRSRCVQVLCTSQRHGDDASVRTCAKTSADEARSTRDALDALEFTRASASAGVPKIAATFTTL